MRLTRLLCVGLVLALVPVGCLYDSKHRCGNNQHEIEYDRCVCDDGFIADKYGCHACGDKEEVKQNACVCVEGYGRTSTDGPCEPLPETQGIACNDTDMPCPAGEFELCHIDSGAEGYCTNSCKSDDDCVNDYRCHDLGADSFCRRQATGHGDECASDDDCAGKEADYCEVIQSHLCLVRCSAGNTAGCFEGESCCDFAIFNPICVPTTECMKNGGKALQ